MNSLKRHNVKVLGLGARTIMFAHGYGCDQKMWRHVAPAFTKEFRVVLFDYIGAGGSDASAYSPERYRSLESYADDVLDIAADLKLENAIFVGHSVSAMIGAIAAIKEPRRFSDLVMIGPSPRYIDDENYTGGFKRADIEGLIEALESNYLGWSSTMAPMIMGNPDRPELGQELANSFCRMDPEIAKNFARLTFYSDNRADLPKIPARTLVLQCSEDIIAPNAVGEYVHNHVPRSEFRKMKATGHCPNLSAPEETVAMIKEFLR
jgi:sigma-B regulation protein RsbQ